ncbi:Tissue inhibitor of metalloproteinase [Lishizhenia tianjinensis]|uniref:Tissue inhibitor of metalloproteinase n=1 Tax=Lishizhenia tianjinensis TaxID=477690 RepID=A0A1I6XP40_9FLAO|nr:hypothetical protein [Lishizhenia tianjinensis]SFT39847.1 Tissue inhibitor of metalloproteinase [Lishizhenia tianjinensis]
MKKIIICFILSLFASIGWACNCPFPGSAKAEMKKHEVVIIGKVISEKWINANDGEYYIYTFQIKEILKGEIKTQLISIKTAPPSPSCSFPFKLEKNYVIYANKVGEELTTSQCTRNTRHWRKEKKALED